MEKITKYQLFTLLAFGLIFLSFYFGIENYNLNKTDLHHPKFAFEDFIPLIPFFVIFYILAYPIGILPFILIKDKGILKKILMSFLMVILISSLIYLIFPTSVIKPELNAENFFSRILLYFRRITPNNIFPSYHASLVLLSSLICNRENKKLGKILFISTFLIALSTLFTKQHYIPDLILGFLISFIVFRLVFKNKR